MLRADLIKLNSPLYPLTTLDSFLNSFITTLMSLLTYFKSWLLAFDINVPNPVRLSLPTATLPRAMLLLLELFSSGITDIKHLFIEWKIFWEVIDYLRLGRTFCEVPDNRIEPFLKSIFVPCFVILLLIRVLIACYENVPESLVNGPVIWVLRASFYGVISEESSCISLLF
jgi:hypothetical protein